MTIYEKSTHSFVIRIWLEEAATATTPALWRGHITHVMTRKEKYFDDLQNILNFISQYLPREVNTLSEFVGVANASHSCASSTLVLDRNAIREGIKMAKATWDLNLSIMAEQNAKLLDKIQFKDTNVVQDVFTHIEFPLLAGQTHTFPIDLGENLYLFAIKRSEPPKDYKSDKKVDYQIVFDSPNSEEVSDSKKEPPPVKRDWITLDSQHVLVGLEMGHWLRSKPKGLTVRNQQDQDVIITILILKSLDKTTSVPSDDG